MGAGGLADPFKQLKHLAVGGRRAGTRGATPTCTHTPGPAALHLIEVSLDEGSQAEGELGLRRRRSLPDRHEADVRARL